MLKNLFVYGTLLDDTGSTMSLFLARNSKLIGTSKMPGQLYDLGNYPGAVYQSDAESFVHGKIFELKHPEKVLQQLDYYEGIGSGQNEENQYSRSIVTLNCMGEPIDCWVYLFQLDPRPFDLIESGNYSTHFVNNPTHRKILRDA